MNTLTAFFIAALIGVAPPETSADSLHVTITGSGKPVIFIPGLIGSEYGYRALISQLDTTRYRSIVIEPLGIGSSARPEGADYSLTAQAERIAAVLDTLVDGPVWLVAHSVGASMAYRIAYRHPDIVRGVVSLEGGPTESLATPGFKTAMKFVPVFRMMGPRAIMGLMRQQMASASADDSWITEETILGYTAGYQRNFDASLNTLRAMSQSKEPERLVDHLTRIQCPVLLLVGGVAHKSGPSNDDIEILTRQIRTLTVDSIQDAGHFVHEENPHAVMVAIERFMRNAQVHADEVVPLDRTLLRSR